MNSEGTSIWKAMSKTPASIVLVVYTFIAVWFVGGLTVFHLYLISRNQVRNSSIHGTLKQILLLFSSLVFLLLPCAALCIDSRHNFLLKNNVVFLCLSNELIPVIHSLSKIFSKFLFFYVLAVYL